ncbi:hypothetical protein GFS03_04175 [Sulfolobus sp. E5-1-F]|nr:hypothetical protein GFS03_04175 [Sulfolobus sp. E5-1-F]
MGERVRNMEINFPEPSDEIKIIADSTGISATTGGQYVVAKWGKRRDSKFIEVIVEKDNLNVEVTNSEVSC